MNKPFHVVIHATPTPLPVFENVDTFGRSLRALQISTPVDSAFACSFEDVTRGFEQIPRMFLEPDGSFVWVIEGEGTRHQLDGLLVDSGTHLLSAELKGTCNEEALNVLLAKFNWPTQEVIFQLVRQGIYMTETDFRELVFIS